MATARANARMALMLALGELQVNAGPDTRVTATGSIMDNPNPSKTPLAGIWDSWKIDSEALPSQSDYEKTGGKKQKFRKWLVSNADPIQTTQLDFISSPDLPVDERVTLMPELRNKTTTSKAVYGGLVPVVNIANRPDIGKYAYAVFDEGAKARIDTGYKPATGSNVGDLATTMGGGVRADVSRISGLEKIDRAAADLSKPGSQLHKTVSYASGNLLLASLGETADSQYNGLFHEVTTSSVGIFADVANGGLKQDLNSILNADRLPADFRGTT